MEIIINEQQFNKVDLYLCSTLMNDNKGVISILSDCYCFQTSNRTIGSINISDFNE